MKLLRSVDHKQMPWKNGGGVTVEIAIHPAHATVDNLDWRISMATVAEDGAFSVFTGIDRTLSILDGAGIILNVADTEQVLTLESDPYFFAADVPTSARLLNNAITDLNVMTRRAAYRHEVHRLNLDGTEQSIKLDGQAFLLLAHGSATVKHADKALNLQALDCATVEPHHEATTEINGDGVAFLIILYPVNR